MKMLNLKPLRGSISSKVPIIASNAFSRLIVIGIFYFFFFFLTFFSALSMTYHLSLLLPLVSPASWSKSKVNDVTKDELMATQAHDSSATDCSQWVKLLLCFSFRKNAQAILSIESSSIDSSKSKQDTLPIIHGLRVITMAWIILGHTYGLVNPHIHSKLNCSEFYFIISIACTGIQNKVSGHMS